MRLTFVDRPAQASAGRGPVGVHELAAANREC
jgi:hypothetical protein